MKKLKDLMTKRNISVKEITDYLDVSASQIYRWDREGISENNPHFHKLKELIPEIQPKEKRIKKNGEEDGRYRSGKRITNKLYLKDINLAHPNTKEFESVLFPKIHINKK